MKKIIKNLKYTTLAAFILFGFTISTNQAWAGWQYSQTDIQYIVTSNPPPTANAGSDRNICLPTSSVSILPLEATATDDVAVMSVLWTHVGGTGTANPVITTPNLLTTNINGMNSVGTYIFRLTATDGGTPPLSDSDDMIVTVGPAAGCLPPGQPDLTASNIAPTSATVNVSTNMTADVSNTGTVATGPGVITHLFQFDDDAVHTGVIPSQEVFTGPVSVGTISISTPHTFPTTGTWYVRACADNNSAFIGTVNNEIREDNNCSLWTAVTVGSTTPGTPVVTFGAVPSPSPAEVNVSHGMLTWTATNNPTFCTALPGGDWAVSGVKPATGNSVDQGLLTQVRTYTYRITCTNAIGESLPARATIVVSATSGVVNGACKTTHFNCAAGTSVPDPHTANNPWTWSCTGSGGGTTATCREAYGGGKPQCSNEVDDDGDLLVDIDDPGCHRGNIMSGEYLPLDDSEKNTKIIEIEV